MKSKQIKLKRRKYNLYSRKKSKGKQALAVILTLIIAAALCVVGFGLGRPIMEYFNGESAQTEESSGWTPPEDTAESAAPTKETAESQTNESAESAEPAEARAEVIYTLPAGALRTPESLKSAAAAAKAKGCTAVVVTLKNASGNYLYVTERSVLHYGDIITGSMTAKEICDIITTEGLVPYARISTLMDKMSGNYIEGIKYYNSDGSGWLDAAYDKGGKFWLNPFAQDTLDYVSSITAEISAAGFKRVILADTIYPVFRNVDLTNYLSNQPHLSDSDKRVDALWDVVDVCEAAAKSNGGDILLEINAADMEAADKTATTGEITLDTARMKSVELLIDYVPVGGSEYAAAKSFAGKMGALYNGQSYSVLIAENSVSDAAYQQLLKAFAESDIVIFSE